MAFNPPKVSIPKMAAPKIDWSRWNFRKFNWLTVLSVISYFNILVLVSMMLKRKSPYVAFHARQGFALLFLWVIFLFSFFIPILPWLLALLILFYLIIGVTNAVTGKERALPLIGRFAR